MTIEKEFFKINLWMSNIESVLTNTFIFGGLKIPLGLIQTITAISMLIFTTVTINVFWENTGKIKNFSKKHVVHGLANILAGIIEITPIGTFAVFIIRSNKFIQDKNHTDYVSLENKKNFRKSYNDSEYDDNDEINKMYRPFLNPITKFFPYYTVQEFREWVNSLPNDKD